jgi:hypothetical protein
MALVNGGASAALTKAQLDGQIGSILTTLDSVMNQIQAMNAFLATQGAAGLEAAPLSYDTTAAPDIISAFSDLDTLRQVYQGLATQGTTKDFRSFPKLLWGTGVH